MLGESRRYSSKIADKQVDLIFEKFDLENTEVLTLDQFIDGCLRDDYLGTMFTHGQSGLLYKWNSGESLASSALSSGAGSSRREALKFSFLRRFKILKWPQRKRPKTRLRFWLQEFRNSWAMAVLISFLVFLRLFVVKPLVYLQLLLGHFNRMGFC